MRPQSYRVLLPLVFILLPSSCMRAGTPPSIVADSPEPDSVTVTLWRMDERGGTRVADSGPFRLDGTAGRATLTQFGRVGQSRSFRPVLDSFVHVPANPVLDLPRPLTVEAWLYIREFGAYEDTPIAARWTEQAHHQSWIFALGGQRLEPPVTITPSPGYHLALFALRSPGHLWFAYQPETAGPPRAFRSTRPVELERWTHVAVTFDGDVVRFFIDGELDAQFASTGRIRSSSAPLLIGNYFDPRLLTRFAGDLRPDIGDPMAYYALNGLIDELRISSVARRDFPSRARR